MQFNALLLPLGRPTRNGHLFTADAVVEASKDLQGRVAAGLVYGEFGSPSQRKVDDPQHALLVALERVCLKVVSMRIDTKGIWGMIEPAGPFGDQMAELITSDWLGQPTLSVRALSSLHPKDPNRVLEVVRFGAFDFVD